MRFVNERTMFKILVEQDGLLVALTLKSRAFFLFLSRAYVGGKVAPTTDPFEGIVEICDYKIAKVVRNWDKLHRVMIVPKARIA